MSYPLLHSTVKQMRPLLLYIENNDNHLRLRSAVLEKHGYVVLAATNASRVLQTLRECPVSLVISDHMLEGLTGTEFVREIKTISPYVPILIYAGTTPQHLGEADCFMSNSEPVKAFLLMIDDLMKRYWG